MPLAFFRIGIVAFFAKKCHKNFYPYESNKINQITERWKKILYKNYIYNYFKETENMVFWRCSKRSCSGRIRTDLNIKTVLFQTKHWHQEEKSKITRLDINNKLKEVALTTNENFDNALISVTEGIDLKNLKNISNINSLRDYFVRRRKSKNLPLITNNDNILEMYKYTFDNELFLQYINNSNENGLIIFSTEYNLNILKKSKIWLCDATFYTSPQDYSQIYIIHGTYFNKILPLCYVIMKNRTENSYKLLFDIVKSKINMEPQYIVVDFELAQYNAIWHTFTNTVINGCVFHYSQIIVRYLQKTNILSKYSNDSDFRKFVKYMIYLSYVPTNRVLCEYNKILLMKKENNEYNDFSNYFYEQFILNSRKNPTKDINFWSASKRIINSIPTTTNSCEAYHRYLNSKINRKRPELGKIIDIFKKEEKRSKIIINNLKGGKINIKDNKCKNIQNIILNYNFYENYEFFESLEELINIYV
ncbi:hypothetical protein DMUE_1911 [Dictyocoela muelleri]|nr:hypothetical protein DMUE_1911 [Dictyocoela muelleri]